MQRLVPILFYVLAIGVHGVPALSVFALSKMSKLYGISAEDQILMPLLQHRAVLFSLVAVACVYAAHNASARWPVLIGAIISMASFIAIAVSRGTTAGALNKIIIVDAVGLLIAAVLIFLLAKG